MTKKILKEIPIVYKEFILIPSLEENIPLLKEAADLLLEPKGPRFKSNSWSCRKITAKDKFFYKKEEINFWDVLWDSSQCFQENYFYRDHSQIKELVPIYGLLLSITPFLNESSFYTTDRPRYFSIISVHKRILKKKTIKDIRFLLRKNKAGNRRPPQKYHIELTLSRNKELEQIDDIKYRNYFCDISSKRIYIYDFGFLEEKIAFKLKKKYHLKTVKHIRELFLLKQKTKKDMEIFLETIRFLNQLIP